VPELGALVVVCALWPVTLGLESSAGGPGPAFVPQLLLAVLGVTSAAGILVELRRSRSGGAVVRPAAGGTGEELEAHSLPRALVASALVLGYVAGTVLLGWVIASSGFAALFLWLSGRRGLWVMLAVAVVAPQVLAYVFVRVVYIPLPTGLGIFDTVTVVLYQVLGIY